MNIDVKWFQDRIRDLGTSQRQVSQAITKNANTMSLILNGKRRVSHEEIPQIAQLLDTTPEEVLKRLGVEPAVAQRSDTVPAVGVVDETSIVQPSKVNRAVVAPSDATANTKAIMFETSTGDGWRHGWVYYFEDTARDRGVDADSLNALSLVSIADKDGQLLGVIRRGLERGRYDLVNAFTGDKIVSGVAIRDAVPITWIKPI